MKKSKGIIIFLCTIIAALVVALTGLVYHNSQRDVESQETIISETPQAHLTLYDKLDTSQRIRILVVGDSIGANSGSSDNSTRWDTILNGLLSQEYGCPVTIDNLSVAGTSSLFGIIKAELQDDMSQYDLAIVCYGQNDSETQIGAHYEALIRNLMNLNANMEVLPVLESSLKDNAAKVEDIQDICVYYGLEFANTIDGYSNSGYQYGELTSDGIHPNDIGYSIYAQEIFDTIKNDKENNVEMHDLPEQCLNSNAKCFENFKLIGINDMDEDDGRYTYLLNHVTALGTYYYLSDNGGEFSVYFNGGLVAERNNYNNINGQMESFEVLYQDLNGGNITIEIELSDERQKNSMIGVFAFGVEENSEEGK